MTPEHSYKVLYIFDPEHEYILVAALLLRPI